MGLEWVVDVVVLVVVVLVLVRDRCREVQGLVHLDKVVFNRDRDREVGREDRKARVITVLPIDLEVVVVLEQQQQQQQRRVLVLLGLELVLVGLNSFIIHTSSKEDLRDIILGICRMQMMGCFGIKGNSRIGDRFKVMRRGKGGVGQVLS